MFKNVASQKLIVFAFDATTNTPKTGDAANITAYVSKDHGAATVLGDTTATELDSTNGKGYYLFDLTQAETNADCLNFTAKSATANIVVIGVPAVVYTVPANFTATSIDSSGRVDVIKIAGTTQTARDIGASVLLSAGTGTGQLDFTSGVVKANATQIAGSAVSTSSAQIGVNVVNAAGTAWASGAITSSVLATDSITSTQLAASAISKIWASVTDSSGVTTLLSRLSSARAGYLDNINNSNLASVPAFPANFASLSITAVGIAKADLQTILATAVTQGASGRLAGAFSTLLDVATPALTVASVNQTGDSYARIGSAGAGLTSIPDSSGVTTLLSRLSATRAGYLDNLSAGAVATASALSALNNISTTQVLAQVNAALDTALTLPGQAAPTETPTIRTGLAQLYQQAIRPYTQDSSSQKLYNAAGSTVLQKRTISDDGTTLTYGALVSGP